MMFHGHRATLRNFIVSCFEGLVQGLSKAFLLVCVTIHLLFINYSQMEGKIEIEKQIEPSFVIGKAYTNTKHSGIPFQTADKRRFQFPSRNDQT